MKKKDVLTYIENYDHRKDWYYEGNISTNIVNFLISKKYDIISHNSEDIRKKGIDIIAINSQGIKELIEIKGYPTEYHTKDKKKGHPKVTNPKLQATHWFSEVILSSIYNYEKYEGEKVILALGLPNQQRYHELLKKVQPFFTDFDIDVKIYFVDINGTIIIKNLNSRL